MQIHYCSTKLNMFKFMP